MNMNPQRIQIYSPYERIWHWLQAAAILLLIVTGLAIHGPDRFGVIPFAWAVRLHNLLGFLVLGNAFLGLFYYITTGTIRQHLPEPRDFVSLSMRQAAYYVRGMFRGETHPLEKSPQRRLNPLQQVTLQLATGLLMWSGQRWPQAVAALGGLSVLAMIHTLGAWLFATFIVAHVYLSTTGTTPLTHLKAMILGYEEAVPGEAAQTDALPAPTRSAAPELVRNEA